MNKLLAIFGRTDAKDFVDLYFILHSYRKLKFEDLFDKAKKKDIGLSEFYLANMLAEVENLADFPQMLKPLDRKLVQKFFLDLSQKLFQKIKPKKL